MQILSTRTYTMVKVNTGVSPSSLFARHMTELSATIWGLHFVDVTFNVSVRLDVHATVTQRLP